MLLVKGGGASGACLFGLGKLVEALLAFSDDFWLV